MNWIRGYKDWKRVFEAESSTDPVVPLAELLKHGDIKLNDLQANQSLLGLIKETPQIVNQIPAIEIEKLEQEVGALSFLDSVSKLIDISARPNLSGAPGSGAVSGYTLLIGDPNILRGGIQFGSLGKGLPIEGFKLSGAGNLAGKNFQWNVGAQLPQISGGKLSGGEIRAGIKIPIGGKKN